MHILVAGGSSLARVGDAIDLQNDSVVHTLHNHNVTLAIIHGGIPIAYDHLLSVQTQGILHIAIDDG